MIYDYLIVGQGIAGTLLAYLLEAKGKSVFTIDVALENSASKKAGAIINPLVAKKWSLAKGYPAALEQALPLYRAMEVSLQESFISEKELYLFPGSSEELLLLEKQLHLANPYLSVCDAHTWDAYFHNPFQKLFKIAGVYALDNSALLAAWRKLLMQKACLSEDVMDYDSLELSPGTICYKNIKARKLIFCEGTGAFRNPFFPVQKFTKNTGDTLLLEIKALPADAIFHNSIRLIPKANQQFWCGSTYNWNHDMVPNMEWHRYCLQKLEQWLKVAFRLSEHSITARPTTHGQVPVLLRHEVHKNMYFFNGLGTRGFSSGPALAQKMLGLIL